MKNHEIKILKRFSRNRTRTFGINVFYENFPKTLNFIEQIEWPRK